MEKVALLKENEEIDENVDEDAVLEELVQDGKIRKDKRSVWAVSAHSNSGMDLDSRIAELKEAAEREIEAAKKEAEEAKHEALLSKAEVAELREQQKEMAAQLQELQTAFYNKKSPSKVSYYINKYQLKYLRLINKLN